MKLLSKILGVWIATALILASVGCEYTTTEYDLTVSTNGSGNVSPSSGTYDEDTTVTLSATAASGWVFTGWSGDASGTSSSTQIIMDSDKSVVANFTLESPDPDPVNNASISGTYAIVASHSGKALDTWEWGTVDGTNIAQYSYWGGDSQHFNITPVDGIWHRITPVIATGQALDVADCSSYTGANIQTWSYLASSCQQFRFQIENGGVYRIINRNSDMGLSVLDGSTADGANIVQASVNSGAQNQLFQLVEPDTTQDPTLTTTTLQAENATIVSGTVESDHSGYTGSGYANTVNASGNYVEFTLTTTAADTYDLTFYFALSSGNRYASIQVNGSTQVSNIDFNGTGAWTNWNTSTASVNLSTGVNTIRLTAEQSGGLANVDKMDVYGLAVTEGDSNSTDPDDPEDPEDPVDDDIILYPGDNLQNAINAISPGQTIWLNGGTYTISSTIIISESNAGTPSARKTVSAIGNGEPVLDWNWTGSDNSSARGIVLDGSYWHFKGITLREAGDNGMLLSGDNNIIERCTFTANRDTGLQLSRYNSNYNSISQWPSNNLIVQCESYDNADLDGEDADGFAAKLNCGEGNIFRGCYAHNNIDDGWDLYTYSSTGPIGKVTIEYCIAYQNGTLTDGSVNPSGDRNGFKLGGEDVSVDHTVRFCIAAENGKTGFTYNRNLGNIKFSNNTAYNNASRNFNFDGGQSTFLNNISLYAGSNDRIIGSSLNPNYNAWWSNGSAVSGYGVSVTSSDFQSLSRGSLTWVGDYGVNLGNYLVPVSGSDLIGSGSGGVNMGAR